MIRELLVSPFLSESETALWVTAEEAAHAAGYGSLRRRAEYLTWRALVRRRLGAGVRIAYDEVGAPVLPETPWYLSVAHCAGCVAVYLADVRCAVDVEPAVRDFHRVVDRIATPAERALSSDSRWPGVLWCVKECLYKYARRPGADFARDLRVESADLVQGRVDARAFDEAVSLTLRLDGEFTIVSIP
ncbi:MAG TPA: 4'-phosphopantetheinyl transferase superfamily protein [Candidatus Alistipes intestinipullorum]|nr:4'-phosphopantetheinyl transferase superfamily protein [Candidatus Alistipes intestinipullorum]